MQAKLPEHHVLEELTSFEETGRPLSDFMKEHFGNMVSQHPSHPYVIAFANKYGLAEYLSQPAV